LTSDFFQKAHRWIERRKRFPTVPLAIVFDDHEDHILSKCDLPEDVRSSHRWIERKKRFPTVPLAIVFDDHEDHILSKM